jgi:hypothetical protein
MIFIPLRATCPTELDFHRIVILNICYVSMNGLEQTVKCEQVNREHFKMRSFFFCIFKEIVGLRQVRSL